MGYLLATLGIAHMLRHRRSPGSTIAWLLAFITLPYLGVAFYLMFGGRKLRQDRIRSHVAEFTTGYSILPGEATETDRFLRAYGVPPATTNNQVSLCTTGVDAHRCLTALIKNAKQRIVVATFIFNRCALGQYIRDLLIERAIAGVDVCVLVDGLGSMKTPRRFFHPLVAAGGHFAVFKPVLHIPFRSRTNLRNHRKIFVVDGRFAFAGGMNITEEDIYPEAKPTGWRDVALVVEGAAASHLEAIVQSDWKLTTGKSLEFNPCPTVESDPTRNAIVQVVPSGPDWANDPIYSCTLTAIFRAADRVWIATPYFVPNDAIVEALVIVSRRGIDVRILIPQRSNHLLSDLAGAPLLRDIQDAGAKVLMYGDGMVHAKAMIVDGDFAAVGSANMDMRSLFLNYEVMQFCYSRAEIELVANWFEELSQGCSTVMPTPGLLRQISEGAIRAVSPLF